MRWPSCGVSETDPQGPTRIIARIRLSESRDVVKARQAVARELKARGASAIRITRFATAVSEIARNALMHGGGGELSIGLDAKSTYLQVECRDNGRGIEDIQQAMIDGFTTAGGLGRGLGGAKRLSDGFELHSETGGGTIVRLKARL